MKAVESLLNEGELFPIRKGQSIWLELKATEDTDLVACDGVMKIYFKAKGIDKLSCEQIILKETYFDDVRKIIMEDLTKLLLENGFLNKNFLENKVFNGGGL